MARLLLMDDSAIQRRRLVVELTRFGHSCVEAENGVEGMSLITAGGFDCVFTDLHMPQMDGFHFLEAVKLAGIHTPIIVMSADMVDDNFSRAKELGAAAFITKPVKIEYMKEALEKVLAILKESAAKTS